MESCGSGENYFALEDQKKLIDNIK